MIDFSALVTEEARTASANRSEWTGEIGETEVTLYSKPICGADFDYLAKRGYRDFMANPTIGGMIEMIAHKAETEAGIKCFKPNQHVPLMKRWGTDKIGEIFGELFGDQMEPETDEDFEARVGNSGQTKTS